MKNSNLPVRCVIGPLVICLASCSRNEEKRLNRLCKKDSKQLTAQQRADIYEELKQFCNFRWMEVSALDLNELMKTISLNEIEAKCMASLIKNVREGDVMIDLPDRYSYTFKKRMEGYGVVKFEAEHKADENYPIVAAASICAKLTRDKKIEEIKTVVGDFGSGYPSDPKTRTALKDREFFLRTKSFIREKWKTLDTIKQRKLFEE